ncbi:hypothetical protein [Aurantiacibacter rhizosphaerae]|uniref:Reverse transcriptase domain-containing protein n=1 Tax=Aurantiacibacter rhizosphaerae TaxID=2691582 RepID=A0A844XAI2_9SPHN|nr:hypothetical protein [Aurantiacibacter rhizosphaerae]MWV27481.1 hypothetical protein [Aurantiacibacter rhizosphaerae]
MTISSRSSIRQTPIVSFGVRAYREFARTNSTLVADLAEQRSRWKHICSQLAGLSRRQQHSLVRKILRFDEFGLFHAYRGVLKAKLIREASRQSLQALADRLDPFSPCFEPMQQREIEKDGRTRLVDNYGPHKRALQHMVADLIRATNPPRANQFMFNGGIPAALSAAEAAYARGLTHAVELDVEGFYRNLPRECLAGLLRPLPEAVVDHVVWDMSIRVAGDGVSRRIWSRSAAPPLNASYGLSLGSASSPIVGEVVIGRLLAANEIDFDQDIITYADNLLVLGHSEQEAEARAERLTALALEPVYGSLRLREKDRGHFLPPGRSEGGGFSTGVPFVGQFGQIEPDGAFNWQPTPERHNRHRIAEREICPTEEEILRAQRRVAASHRAYPRWATRELREAEERASLSAALYMRSPTPERLASAGRDLVFALIITRWEGRTLEELVPEYDNKDAVDRREDLIAECARLLNHIRRPVDTDRAA